MVGIFTGLGSGLERGSANILGGSGLLGSAAFGRSGEQLFLNAATGGLLVSQSDEFLVGRGPDAAIGRTYDSLGNATDENGDNWRQSTDRRIFGETGTRGASGATVTRRSADGSEIVYTCNGSGVYVATDGAGAYDTLTYASGTGCWTWTDGDTHVVETYEVTYASAAQWRLKQVADNNGVTMSCSYIASSDHLDKVTTSDGGYIQYGWSGNSITQIVTHYTDLATGTAKTLTRVRYAYDSSNRLITVTTDLTPGDNSVSDGAVYTATYTYDGSSTRVATITESDGSSIAIGYDATSHKVISITQTITSGVTRVTGVAYTSSTVTTVTDPLGQATTLEYNADGSLKKITAPPALSGAAAQTVQFTYDTSGNVLTVTDAAGAVTTYSGYSNGNWTTRTDPLSNVVTRTYDAANNLTSETQTGADGMSSATLETTRYVYDSANRLVWMLSAKGRGTNYVYDSYGQLTRKIQTALRSYDTSTLSPTTMLTAAEISGFLFAPTDKSAWLLEEMTYDARGNMASRTGYATVDTSGNGVMSAGYTTDTFVYDQAGRLLSRMTAGLNSEQFVYDGLGRMTASTDLNGGTTSFVFTDSTADNGTKTVITTAAGYVQTYTYNRAGDLVSMTDSGTGVTGGTTGYQYDALGRVRVATDANSNKTYTLYDRAGRKTADIDDYGYVREYRYDADNRLVATVRWINAVSGTNLTALANPANTLEIAAIRPSADAADIWSWKVYDADGRTVQTIEGDGSVTSYGYDASGHLIKTLVYGNKLTSTQLATIRVTAPATTLTPAASSNDAFSRTFYDKDGFLLGTLDFAGNLIRYLTDGAGRQTSISRYSRPVDPGIAETATFMTILATFTSADIGQASFFVRDGENRLRYVIDTVGGVAQYDYGDGTNEGDAVRRTVHYAGTIPVLTSYGFVQTQTAIATAGLAANADTRIGYTVYDAAGRAAFAIDASGAVTGFGYDSSGRLIKTVQYATTRSTSSLPSYATMASWTSANATSGDRVTRAYYTGRGELAYAIDGEGYVTGKAYDAEGQLITEKRWNTPIVATDSTTLANVASAVASLTSTTTSYTYDLDGRVATMRDGEGHGHDYTYYGNGLLAWDIRMSGSTADESRTRFVYDPAGRLTDRYDGWTSTSAATHYAYDGRGNQVSVTDPNGKTLTRSFDRNGRVLNETDPLGGTTTYQYDSYGNVVKTTDARGNSSYSYYDSLGRIVATRDAENYVTTTAYTSFGQAASVTRHSARATNAAVTGALPTWTWDGTDVPRITSYEYDKLGHLAKVTDPLAGYSQVSYNAFGEQSVIRDERGMLTSDAYDKRGLLKTQVVDTAGKAITTSYTYDARGQVLTATDANGKVTISTYDLAGRLATIRDALNNVTTYTYDGRDNLVAVTDALGKITRTIYDANDRRVATIDALGGVVTYAYDAEGHLISQLEYKARVNTGSMALQVSMSTLAPLLATNADDRTTRYAYDDNGRLRFTVDAQLHVVEMEYDAAGNVVRTTAHDGAVAGTTFTASGIAAQVASLSGSPRTTRAVYDAIGRLTYAIDALGHVTWSIRDAFDNIVKQVDYSVAYTATGNPTIAAMTTWQGSAAVVAGAAGDRTTRAWFDADGRAIYSLDALGYVTRVEYDAGGNVTRRTRYTEAYSASDATTAANLASFYGTPASPQVTQFTYDTAGRLTETLDAEGNKTRLVLSQAGQVISSTSAADTGDAHVVSYTYDDGGRVATRTVQIGTSPSGSDLVTAYTYDAAGNQVKVHDARGNDSYFYYDALGQQIAARDAESYVTETAYTRFGDVASVTRHSAKATNTPSTTLPSWTWAGTDAPATTNFEYNTLSQLTKSTDATGAYEQYTLGTFGERLGVRNKLGGVSTYSYDKNGLVLTETLPSGIAVNRYEYDAYGNRTKMIEADGAPEARTTLYAYDKLDQLLATVGDAVTVLSASLVESSYTPTQALTYDSRGNVIKSVDADAQTFFYYDRNDRLIAQIGPAGTVSTFAYDGNGNRISQKVFGTAVSLPGAPGGTPPAGSGDVRETRYGYDRANRLVSTTLPGLQTGEYAGGAWAFTTADIVSGAEYDAAGNVTREVDGRGNSIYHWYDKAGREVARIDEENYLTAWERDAEGNATKETRYANKVTGGFTSATAAASLPGLLGTGAADADRITDFTYDKNGRRLTETRESVAYVAVDGSGTVTSGTTTSTITYAYNGLGQVLTKVEANGDTTGYTYDTVGRLTLETGQGFTDNSGASVSPRTAYAYDGLNNLKSTRVQVDASGTNAADRVTAYTYGAGGRLATMTDANLQTHTYGYDKAGRTVLDRYTRVRSDGSSVTEAKVTLYDVAGRAVTQTSARLSGTSWLFTSELAGNPAYDAVNLQYNAFGDLTDRGVSSAGASAAYQEHFWYDLGGRLWKSNTGDGVLRFHVYDKAGNETLTLASTGADLSSLTGLDASVISTAGDYIASTVGAVTTVTLHDKRGQAIATREPDRQFSGSTGTITGARTYNAFGEALSETDARNFTTSFTYNSMGRMLSRVSPAVSVTSETGVVTTVNPTEYYGYDLSGRLDRVTDANGNVTRRALLGGTGHGDGEALVTREFHADTGVFETRYDVFGDARSLIDELGNAETRTYDRMAQLDTVTHRGGNLVDHYSYDILGQRTRHWITEVGTSTISGIGAYAETTDYDAQGRVVSTVGMGGDAMAYRYVWDAGLSTSGLGDFDGWVKTSVNVSAYNGAEVKMTESTDYFGRAIGSTDFAANATTMAFDKGGRLVTQVIGGAATTSYSWYNTGLQATVTTGSAVSTYSYDIAGARHSEQYVVGGTTYQDATATWDALGRMTNFHDNGVSGGAAVNIDYEYDAVGNVRHLKSVYTPLGDSGDPAGGATGQDYWYVYDSMNRFVITQGQLVKWGSNNHIAKDGSGNYIVGDAARGVSGAAIERYLNGTSLSWDNAGNRMTAARTLAVDSYEAESGTSYIAFSEEKESYTYSADGYLARTDIVQGPSTAYFNYAGDVYRKPNAASGTGVGRALYTRDVLGRVTAYSEYNPGGYVPGSPGSNLAYSRTAAYDAGGRVTQDTTVSVRSDGTFTAVSDYSYNASLVSGRWDGVASGGTYMGGAVTRVTTRNSKNNVDGDAPDTVTINGHVWGKGGTVLTYTGYDKDTGDSGNTVWTSSYARDGSGYLTGAAIADERPRTVALVNDAEGRVLQRDEADLLGGGDPRQLHYYFNGIRVGDISNNGTSNTDYASSIAAHVSVPAYGPFRLGASTGAPQADFDQSYDAINGLTYDGAPSTYTVQGGDTLQGIAHQLWGDASLWYLIADANGLAGSEALAAGRLLAIPNKVHNRHNNADTFRPYDPNEAQGDLSPTGAKKPRGNKCGAFGLIMMVVIAVAVTAFTTGAAMVAMGQATGILSGISASVAGAGMAGAISVGAMIGVGAVAGIAGSLASQGFGIAIGAQKNINWKGVAIAGTAGGIGGGLNWLAGPSAGASSIVKGLGTVGRLLKAQGFVGGTLRGLASSAATQGVARATGLQKDFDWVGVAAAGIGSGASGALGQHLQGLPEIARNALTGMAGGIANVAARSLILGTDFGDNIQAALPDIIGNTIGN